MIIENLAEAAPFNEAHLIADYNAMASSQRVEGQSGWSMKKLALSTYRYSTVTIRAGSEVSAHATRRLRRLAEDCARRRPGLRIL